MYIVMLDLSNHPVKVISYSFVKLFNLKFQSFDQSEKITKIIRNLHKLEILSLEYNDCPVLLQDATKIKKLRHIIILKYILLS
jgi:hypothetical protein